MPEALTDPLTQLRHKLPLHVPQTHQYHVINTQREKDGIKAQCGSRASSQDYHVSSIQLSKTLRLRFRGARFAIWHCMWNDLDGFQDPHQTVRPPFRLRYSHRTSVLGARSKEPPDLKVSRVIGGDIAVPHRKLDHHERRVGLPRVGIGADGFNDLCDRH